MREATGPLSSPMGKHAPMNQYTIQYRGLSSNVESNWHPIVAPKVLAILPDHNVAQIAQWVLHAKY